MLAALAVLAAASIEATAQNASGYVEFRGSRSDTETTDSNGNRVDRRTDLFEQRYNLDVAWRLYPNVTVRLGGLFEQINSDLEAAGVSVDSRARTFRPFLTAQLRSAIYTGQFAYYLVENDVKAGGTSTSFNREVYNAIFGWQPEDEKSAIVRWIRNDGYDDYRIFTDTRDDLVDLTLNYTPIEQLNFYYRGAAITFEDKLNDVTVDRRLHSFRANYGDNWLDRRVRLDGEYLHYETSAETTTSGTGDVDSPLFPIAGLSSLDAIPIDDALLPNPLLIDDDRAASAGINLVYDPSMGGVDTPRNIGLDFGTATTVNILSVWIDNDLSADPGIENAFVWEIFTSSDNLNWTPEPPVASVTFGPFVNRFEIEFAELSSRYIKVVVSPLSTPIDTSITDIFVTELDAFRRSPAADVQGKSDRTYDRLTSNFRAQILGVPKLYYELTSSFQQFDGMPTLYLISNGLSVNHAFTPQYSVAGRMAYQNAREGQGKFDTLIYSASLRADFLETLQSHLVINGRSTDFEGQVTRNRSAFLYTTADLYRGISANLGFGRAESVTPDGETSNSTIVNAQATLVPHRTTTFNLLYLQRSNTRDGGTLTLGRKDELQAAQVSLAYRPLSALYFYAAYRRENLPDGRIRYLRNYSASWNPFAGGAVVLLFRFDESYNSQFEALSRIASPRIRWNVTNRWYMELAYTRATFDSIFDLRDTNLWTASTRMTF